MTKCPGAVDMSINFECDDETVTFIKKFLCINKIGIVSNIQLINKANVTNRDSIILKINNINSNKINEHEGYMYLLYENLHDNADQKGMAYDILLLNSPFNYKSVLRKLAGKNIGFEILISKLKYCNSYEVGAWFSEVKYIHYLCKKYRHQLILSSGASNAYELISAKMFNSFLNKLDISPNEYWSSLNEWLENKHRGIIYDLE
jgi:hypothetical protein